MKLIAALLLVVIPIFSTDDYDTWHQRRVENLKSEDGWLNLAGLFWLNEGEIGRAHV